MPGANRHSLPGHIWHITHRCHKHEFLLKFSRDRERWCYWLFQAKKRYGLCVLSYIVTSNHIHLLVKDTGEYLARCLIYIDMNMVQSHIPASGNTVLTTRSSRHQKANLYQVKEQACAYTAHFGTKKSLLS